ncbi:ABC transporter ATP-binding protein [Leucobacter sp. GX24907]
MAQIELVDIVKKYGDVLACDEIGFHAAEGEFVTLLGPSGCGKSTTLNMIAGLESITGGDLLFDGRRVNDLRPFDRDVAMVFQSYGLYPHMTVFDNIAFTLKTRKAKKDEIKKRVEQVAASLELGPLLKRYPRELSGGQQQRVAIGRAIVREPSVFLFDEPFSNLDTELRVRMRSEIKQLHEKLSITSVFVTHDQEEALSLSDKIVVLGGGKVQQVGSAEEVYYRPSNKYVASFIGSPKMNFLQGEVVVGANGLEYRSEDLSIPLRLHQLPEGVAPDSELGVRPEALELLSEAGSDTFSCRVLVSQPLGAVSDILATTASGREFTVRVSGFRACEPGSELHLRVDPDRLNWFASATGERIGA